MNALLESNSKEQIPSWEANRKSASQEIPRILWNPKVLYRIQKRQPICPYPDPNQFSPCSPCHFFETCFNIMLPSTPGSSKWSLSLRSPHQNPAYSSPIFFLKTRIANLRAKNRELRCQKCYPLRTFPTILVITLTLLWYHEKSYVNSTIGSIWTHCKKFHNTSCVEFLIILHLVSLSVGLTFTPGIGWTTICCALRTQSYCTNYRWIWFSCPLIWDKCHLTNLKTPERRCTTIPVVLPLCYAPHVTEHHKRKKIIYITWKVLWGQYVPKRK